MFNNAAAANPFEAASNLGQKRGMGEEEEQPMQQYQQEQHAQAHPEMPGFKRRMVSDLLACVLARGAAVRRLLASKARRAGGT